MSKNLSSTLDSLIEGKIVPLKINHKIGIAAVIMAIPLAAFIFLSFLPKSQEADKLNRSRVEVEKEIKTNEETVAQLPGEEAKSKETNLKFKVAKLLMPPEKEISSLLTNISSLGSSVGLDVISFNPGVGESEDFYAEKPVSILINGPYHSIGMFLDKINKLARIVSVTSINLGGSATKDGELYLNARFTLTAYRYILEGEKE
jgi:type IV pilus assembly protein PilO